MTPLDLFRGSLPPAVGETLRHMNPHWSGGPGPATPTFRRWVFRKLMQLLQHGLAPGVVLRGPRRVGKTVLARQVIGELLRQGVAPQRILYVAFDELPTLSTLVEPVLEIARGFETAIAKSSFNRMAERGEVAYLLFDEVQNLDDWAPQLKHLVDQHTVRVLVAGSSSLRIDAGKDSIAGRVQTLTIGPLLLREIAELRDGSASEPHWVDNGMGELAQQDFWRAAVAKAQTEQEVRRRSFRLFRARRLPDRAREGHEQLA